MSPQEEQLTIAELNPDGYIECYEDLDCPDPIEVPENKTISSFSCSGEIKSQLCLHRLCSGEISFQPTAQEVRVFNSTGKYKVCEETVRWDPLLKDDTPQKLKFLKQIQLLPGKQQTDRRV